MACYGSVEILRSSCIAASASYDESKHVGPLLRISLRLMKWSESELAACAPAR